MKQFKTQFASLPTNLKLAARELKTERIEGINDECNPASLHELLPHQLVEKASELFDFGDLFRRYPQYASPKADLSVVEREVVHVAPAKPDDIHYFVSFSEMVDIALRDFMDDKHKIHTKKERHREEVVSALRMKADEAQTQIRAIKQAISHLAPDENALAFSADQRLNLQENPLSDRELELLKEATEAKLYKTTAQLFREIAEIKKSDLAEYRSLGPEKGENPEVQTPDIEALRLKNEHGISDTVTEDQRYHGQIILKEKDITRHMAIANALELVQQRFDLTVGKEMSKAAVIQL